MAFKWPPFLRKTSPKDRSGNIWKIGRIKINKTLRVPIILFILFLTYGCVNFAVYHYNPVRTTPAMQYSKEDSFSATGYFIRDEQVIDTVEGDTVEYNYSDGDKVAKGASLITEYRDEETLTISRELNSIQDSIEQLQTLQSASSVNTNSNQLNQKIIAQINAINASVEDASLGQISALTSELRQLALKSGSLEGGSEDVGAELSSLQAQADALQARLDGKTSEITSPYAGYFCEAVDGFEDILTTSVIDDLTVSSLDELVTQKKEVSAGKGKIISSYVWYFAARVSDGSAGYLKEGSAIDLRFSQINQDIQATVFSIRDDPDSEDTLVIFRSQNMDDNLVSMRKQVASVVVASYSGLRVPKSAVRMEDDTMGVYVLSNSVARYKSIEPLFEGDDYYIVKQNVTGNDSLVINDDIIVEAKDLDDKKVVK